MLDFVEGTLAGALRGWPKLATNLVGIAGTVTTLAAVSLGLKRYSHGQVHGCVLAKPEVDRLVSLLQGSTIEKRREIPGIEPGRADVILAGAVILERIMTLFGHSRVLVSDHGVRYGVVRQELGRGMALHESEG
jgi:exopolyphosphatase/guanosine-5'-triphosphate,3'-diphosphate pyrophosphatase